MKMLQAVRNRLAAFWVFALALMVFTSAAFAQTDITGVITEIEGYLEPAIAVAIAILLFVLGRKVVRRLI